MNSAATKAEIRPMLAIAGPVILAELGWVAMGIVDTMMVGRLGAEVLGGVGIGRMLFLFVAVFGIGMLLGLDTLVSHSFGEGRLDECRRSLAHGMYLAAALSPLSVAAVWLLGLSLPYWGVTDEVSVVSRSYIAAVAWSALPLLAYVALRRYLQAVHLVRPITVALITANLVNVLANWILIFGNLGVPAQGPAGAGWATCISTIYLAGFLALVVRAHARDHLAEFAGGAFARFEPHRMRRLVALGLPTATQLLLEIGVFTLVSVLVGRLEPRWLAAHHIALMIVSVTYMVPLGISSAGAVRVGFSLGARDPAAAGRAGWIALALGGGFMLVAAGFIALFRDPLVRAFTPDPTVIAAGGQLLLVGALFQLFDGLQVVATGTLRGAADTRTPLVCNLIGYWIIGLPVGYTLGMRMGWGAVGFWLGLTSGLFFVGVVLVFVWWHRTRTWNRTPVSA